MSTSSEHTSRRHLLEANKDLEEFFSDLKCGRTPGSKGDHKKWSEWTYRCVNTVSYLNLVGSQQLTSSELVSSAILSGLKTTQSSISTVLQFCQSLIVAEGQQSLKDIDKGSVMNPDLYLFLLCSPVIEASLEQGGGGKMIEALTFANDCMLGRDDAGWMTLGGINQKIDRLQEELFPGVPKKRDLITSITTQLVATTIKKCRLPYEEKKGLARDIANLVATMYNEDLSLGKRVGQLLNFARRHGVTDVIVNNSDGIADLACDIWATKAEATEVIGFDSKAVLAMKPVIQLVLKEGLSSKSNSFRYTQAFVETLVDMISMDYADPKAPVLVDLTERIFDLTAANSTIRNRLSSKNYRHLTPESEGLNEYFRGYFTNLFKQAGLSMSLRGALATLDQQQQDAIAIISQKRGQNAAISEIKSVFRTERIELRQCLANLEDYELFLQAQAKLSLLDQIEAYADMEAGVVKAGKNEDIKALRSLERELERINKFAQTHHIQQSMNDYLQVSDDAKALSEIRIRMNSEIERTDFNKPFFHGEDLIKKARQATDDVLAKHKLYQVMHQGLSALPKKNQQAIQAHAKSAGLNDEDIEHLLSTPKMQNALRRLHKPELEGKQRAKRVNQQAAEAQRLERRIKNQLSQSATGKMWWIQCLLTYFTVPKVFKWIWRMRMGTAALLIREYVKSNQHDQSDATRIMKSLDMIIRFNPGFWRWIIKTKGQDIRRLVNAVMIDQQAEVYLHTRPARIADDVKGIFEYVIRTAISKKETYEPVNLLLSTWTDPEQFDRRHQELMQKYHEMKQEKPNIHPSQRVLRPKKPQ